MADQLPDLDIVWERPPEKGYTSLAARVAKILRDHPGDWAKILTNATQDTVEHLRSTLISGQFAGGKKQKGQYKARRTRTAENIYDLHAVYVGHLSDEDKELV